MDKRNKLHKGQSIIEAVVVIALTSIVIVALVVLGNVANKNASLVRKKSEANKFASSAMEAVRYVRDGCGLSIIDHSTCYEIKNNCPSCVCGVLENIGTCSYPNGLNYVSITGVSGDFERAIFVQDSPNIGKEISVVVRWQEAGGYKDVVMKTLLTE